MVPILSPHSPPTSRKAVAAFEQSFGVTLPEEYVAFLIRCNGGEPEPPFVPIADMPNNDFFHIRSFYGLNATASYNDLLGNNELLSDRLKYRFVAIAESGSAQYLCLSVLGPKRGQIWIWDQVIAWGRDYDTLPMFLCANSFNEFINSFVDSRSIPWMNEP